MGGDSSYDYGAAMTETRHVWREKYSEMKLQANFFKVSPEYLTAVPGNATNGTYTVTTDITVTPVIATESSTEFYIVRHANWTSLDTTTYNMTLSTSIGDVTVPQQGGHFTLFGRDSKIFLTDYNVGGINMIYSSAEVFTWTTDDTGKTVLVMYGGADELHELALPASLSNPSVVQGTRTSISSTQSAWIIQWNVVPDRQILSFGSSLEIHLLWRNDAYTLWGLELEAPSPISNYSSSSKDMVVVKGGYLLRTAAISGSNLYLTGDLNCTTTIELISAPLTVECLFFNGEQLNTSTNMQGKLESTIEFVEPSLSLPSLVEQTWWSISSLPELSDTYSDNAWTECGNTYTTNPLLNLSTPTSLYASDYGFHTSSLLYRGHFTALGSEISFFANTSGGWAFGHSAWLNDTYLGSWAGDPGNKTYAQTFTFPDPLIAGAGYVLTLLIDHMGQDEEAPGTDAVKFPMGLLDYSLSNRSKSDITWKIQGNLGGESYIDKARGPRNEGALFVERMGYHLPSPPISIPMWSEKNPILSGTTSPGNVEFFATNFTLAIPRGYDVPLSFVFYNTSASTSTPYRAQLWVNGWQFGKYISHLGPQTSYPVPEGVLNHQGVNWVGVSIWSLDDGPAKLDGLELVAYMPVMSGMAKPAVVDSPAWTMRQGAY